LAENLSARNEPSQELTSTAESKEEVLRNESVFKI